MERRRANRQDGYTETEFVVSPFQYLWIKPRVKTRSVDALDAADVVRRELDSICSVEVIDGQCDDLLPQVRISNLEVSCPYCAEEKHLDLDFKQWKYLQDWSEKEIGLLMQEIDRSLSDCNSIGCDDEACEEVVRDINLLLSSRCGEASAPQKLIEAVEKILAKKKCRLDGFNPAQLHFQFSDIPLGRTVVRLRSTLLGLYKCPYCEETFAIFFSDDEVDSSPEANFIERALSNFIDRAHQWDRIGVGSDGSSVVLEIQDESDALNLKFFIDTGIVKLNDVCVVNREVLSAMLSDSRIDIGLFRDPELVERVAAELSASPAEVLWTGDGLTNLHLLLLVNRFVGYPASFYRQLVDHPYLFDEAYPLDSGLPRCFEDIDRAFEMTGLPNKKSIRRRLFKDPVKLLQILRLRGLPFENVDVINAFLDDRDFSRMIEAMMEPHFPKIAERTLFFWRELSKIKGETVVLRFLQMHSHEGFTLIKNEVADEYWPLDSWAREAIAKTPMPDLLKHLPFIRWASENPNLDLDERFMYTGQQKNLEDTLGEISFELPASAREYVIAGLELHNCMGSLPAQTRVRPDEIHLLIKRGNRYLGGLTVKDNKMVTEARGACNAPLRSEEDLWPVFCVWQESHGLTVLDEVRYGLP